MRISGRLQSRALREKMLFLTPGLGYLAILFVAPLLYTTAIALTQWNLLRPDLGIRWTGLSNFLALLRDPFTWETLARTLWFVAGSVAIELVFGMVVALALNRDFPGAGIVRSIILIPFIIAPVVVGFTWRFLLNNDFGPLPYLFSALHLRFLVDPPLLANANLVMPMLILVDAWQYAPFVVLVLLAGLKALPHEPYEAALVDGAGPVQQFLHITLPLLRPAILVAIVIRTMTSLRVFDTVFIMTGGGPGSSSEVLSFYGYRMAFQSYQMGLSAAIGLLTLFVALILTVFTLRLSGGQSE